MLGWLPAPLHRALLPIAFRVRHRWRQWRGTPIRGCAVVITNLRGEVLLLRHSYGPAVWALPGGGIDKGELPAAAAIREIAEELDIALDHVDEVGVFEEQVSGSPLTAHIFAAKTDQQPMPDGREILEARFFDPDAWPEPLGRITRSRLEHWRDHNSDN